jgi:ubiquinol-cytochrome c reductase iron-sulfur subunit
VTARRTNGRAYRAAVVAFVISAIGGLVAAVGYATGHTEKMLGMGLAAALTGIGFGLVYWAKYLDLDEHVAQAREPLRTSPADQAAFHHEVELATATLGRRKLLLALFGGSFGSLVIGFVGPLGSLGPKPRGERDRTAWRDGVRLVTSEGAPVELASEVFDQVVTVFPDGFIGQDDSQVVLLRVRPELLTAATVANGAVDGWVAYSKICTHAGCSVGLFGIDSRAPELVRELVCPCHQSVFDPLDRARPVGGPATRSLPQLPLAVDDGGFLVATSDFDRPVGPIAWDEG